MFVDKTHNAALALRLWEGRPSAGLLWSTDADWGKCRWEAGAPEDVTGWMQATLGCLLWGQWATVSETVNPFVEIAEEAHGEDRVVEYRSEAGTLREVRRAGQIIRPKVQTPEQLRALVEMWRHLEVRPALGRYERAVAAGASRGPVVLMSTDASAVQHLLQHETGVANFWYLLADCPALVEEAMELWQAALERQYRIMEGLPVPRWYQAENTSTTMISPAYYERYSLGQIRQFTAAAQRSGARTVVHMCGLLRDLLPLLRRTGMNGIHLLTPPPVGDTNFSVAQAALPEDIILMGRCGAREWIGRTREEMVTSLRRLVPPEVYQRHAFMLLATGDGAEFSSGDLERMRDAVEEYEGEG